MRQGEALRDPLGSSYVGRPFFVCKSSISAFLYWMVMSLSRSHHAEEKAIEVGDGRS